jgi:DNA-binding CsgD family transcriptional regulator
MQLTLALPSASGRAPEQAAPRRVAIQVGDRGLAAVLAAELALTPGLALVRPGDLPDVAVTDTANRIVGRRILRIGGVAGPTGPRLSAIDSRDPRLIAAAALLLASGYRLELDCGASEVHREAGAAPGPLTARERQVAELLVEGASNKVIARRLDISVHTAKFHVAAVLEKLGARNRSDAVAIALRDGLVAL